MVRAPRKNSESYSVGARVCVRAGARVCVCESRRADGYGGPCGYDRGATHTHTQARALTNKAQARTVVEQSRRLSARLPLRQWRAFTVGPGVTTITPFATVCHSTPRPYIFKRRRRPKPDLYESTLARVFKRTRNEQTNNIIIVVHCNLLCRGG